MARPESHMLHHVTRQQGWRITHYLAAVSSAHPSTPSILVQAARTHGSHFASGHAEMPSHRVIIETRFNKTRSLRSCASCAGTVPTLPPDGPMTLGTLLGYRDSRRAHRARRDWRSLLPPHINGGGAQQGAQRLPVLPS